MPSALWKGAISFGLVHVPVELYPAAQRHSLDMDLLDRRTMAPIGYKKINKATGNKVYALLRETMKRAGCIAISTVVIQ